MTQMLHWTKHTATYFENVNKAIKPFPALQVWSPLVCMPQASFACLIMLGHRIQGHNRERPPRGLKSWYLRANSNTFQCSPHTLQLGSMWTHPLLMQALTVEQMMPAIGTDSIPMNISKAVRNNAGGVYNHLLFFKVWHACMPCLSGALRPVHGP